MKKAWVLSYPLSAQWRLWSDWVDAQADLSLRWAHTHFVAFVISRFICQSADKMVSVLSQSFKHFSIMYYKPSVILDSSTIYIRLRVALADIPVYYWHQTRICEIYARSIMICFEFLALKLITSNILSQCHQPNYGMNSKLDIHNSSTLNSFKNILLKIHSPLWTVLCCSGHTVP